MIQRPKDWDNVQAYGDLKMLPKGAYGLVVKGVAVEKYTHGDVIKLMLDVYDGEYANFFMDDWKTQQTEDKKWHCNYLINIPKDDGSERDGWTKRSMKTVMNAFEDSNGNFHWAWDETKLKGLLIGGLFNLRQYKTNDGSVRTVTNLKKLISTPALIDGKFKMPDDDLLKEDVSPAMIPMGNTAPGDLPW